MKQTYSQQKISDEARQQLQSLGKLLAIARKRRSWRQIDLAERVGATRQTIARMEKGESNVSAGVYFMAAWLLDVPIFAGMEKGDVVSLLNETLPERIKVSKEKPVDDNF